MRLFERKPSYVEIKIPIKQDFKETQEDIKIFYHEEFSEWFMENYLQKINKQVTKNIHSEIVSTVFKLRLPKNILMKYKIYDRITHIKHRYRLPKLVYEKIKNIWKEKGWSLNIIDDAIIVKNYTIHDISDIKHKLIPTHIIIRIVVYNTNDPINKSINSNKQQNE